MIFFKESRLCVELWHPLNFQERRRREKERQDAEKAAKSLQDKSEKAPSSGPPSGVDIDKFLEEQGIAPVNKVKKYHK